MRTHGRGRFHAALTVVLLASALSLGCARGRGTALTGWWGAQGADSETVGSDEASIDEAETPRSAGNRPGARVAANTGANWTRSSEGRAPGRRSGATSGSGNDKGVVYLSSFRGSDAPDREVPRDPFLHDSRVNGGGRAERASSFGHSSEIRSAERSDSAPHAGRGTEWAGSRTTAADSRGSTRPGAQSSQRRMQQLRAAMERDVASRDRSSSTQSEELPPWVAESEQVASSEVSANDSSAQDSSAPVPPFDAVKKDARSRKADAVAATEQGAAENVEFVPPPPGSPHVARQSHDQRDTAADPARGRLTGKAHRGMIVNSDSLISEFSEPSFSPSRPDRPASEDETVYPVIRSARERSRSGSIR